jgi:hypothetical protein
MEVFMTPRQKISTIVIVLALQVVACGQIEVGVEPISEEPPPLPPTKTADAGNTRDQTKQSTEKNPLPTNTKASSPEPTNTEVSTSSTVGSEGDRLDCSDFGSNPLTTIACNVQDSFISRNTQALLGYMPPEFALGYWQSEWTTVTPEYVLEYFHNYFQPPNPDQMTFTTDRAQFPPLFGAPPETMMHPDTQIALIIYSEGWGQDGLGAVLLFITGNETSGYKFSAMVVDGEHFDK